MNPLPTNKRPFSGGCFHFILLTNCSTGRYHLRTDDLPSYLYCHRYCLNQPFVLGPSLLGGPESLCLFTIPKTSSPKSQFCGDTKNDCGTLKEEGCDLEESVH